VVCFFFSARDQETPHHPSSTEDVLFDMFRNEETDILPIGMFLSVSISGYIDILNAKNYKTRLEAYSLNLNYVI
jgi:hypothetical protein